MIIGGLDFETSGQDPKLNSVVEIGLVLWCTELRRPVSSTGRLVYDPNAVWEEGTTAINGITQEQCKANGIDNELALKHTIQLYRHADIICTHNGTIFDKIFYENWCERFGYLDYRDQGKTWIDTKIDIQYPKGWSTKLKYLALEHGIFHAHAHGALPDATVMLEILDRYPLSTVIESAKSPTVIVMAQVSYEEKDKAKAMGFYWRPETKQWIKSIKASRIQDEVTSCAIAGFPVKIIKK